MPRKRRKKNGRAGRRKTISALAKGIFKGALRAAPFGIGIFLLSASFAGFRKILYADGALAVRRVEVTPPQSLSIEELARLEEKVIDKNILKVDLNQLSRELERRPQIRSARVKRSFPNRVRVEIEPRLPMAFIRFSTRGPVGLVSKDGVILKSLREPDGSACLIEAVGLGSPDPASGQKINHRGFAQTVEFIEAYRRRPLAEKEVLSKMSYDSLGNVSVTLGAGPWLRLGRRPSQRLEALEKFMNLLQGENRNKIEYVDLQFDNVVIKRKGS